MLVTKPNVLKVKLKANDLVTCAELATQGTPMRNTLSILTATQQRVNTAASILGNKLVWYIYMCLHSLQRGCSLLARLTSLDN